MCPETAHIEHEPRPHASLAVYREPRQLLQRFEDFTVVADQFIERGTDNGDNRPVALHVHVDVAIKVGNVEETLDVVRRDLAFLLEQVKVDLWFLAVAVGVGVGLGVIVVLVIVVVRVDILVIGIDVLIIDARVRRVILELVVKIVRLQVRGTRRPVLGIYHRAEPLTGGMPHSRSPLA